MSQLWGFEAGSRRPEGEEPVGRRGLRPAGRSAPFVLFATLASVLEAVALAVGFDDVDAMVDAAGLVDAVLNSFEENALDPSEPVIVRVTGPSPGGKFRVNRKKEQHWRSSWMYSRNSLVYSFSIEMM